jgi:hydroxymethylpyrimidine/phosphomethylpyrimidine kinase
MPQTAQRMVQQLFPLASVVTPNLDEISVLLGREVRELDQMEDAAHALMALGARAVLLKGGHLPGDALCDMLLQPDQPALRLHRQRVASSNVHGTGCTLSSAVAAHLALGHDLQEAVRRAHQFVGQAIVHGVEVRTGHGNGPLNHAFAPVKMQTLTLDTP